ncbi:unnamed protein product [Trichogramma brassicae]|uniref:Uncharacterized protein n=1 Tax=Trichogramma brassicae TaxID=86971 RepID=A0A6H5HUY4_9HYME|nr:unnamed protein product [Trichogramma brassicae]
MCRFDDDANDVPCVLKNPTMYICTKDRSRDSCHGLTAFWMLVDDTYWYPSEEVNPEEHIVATTVLSLPNFLNVSSIEANGTIFCEFDDKLFQTRLPVIRLDVQDTVNGRCAIDLDDPQDAPFSILALKVGHHKEREGDKREMKRKETTIRWCVYFFRSLSTRSFCSQAISVDRVVLLPVQTNSNTGKRLIDFLDEYNFKEVCKVCIVRDAGSLQYCLIEVLPAEDTTDIRLLISAR